jgi:hypothetical protein
MRRLDRMIPQMTQVALRLHEKDMVKEYPDFNKKKFLYRLSMSEYEKEWGKDYTKPDFGTRVWSEIFRFMPKIGPFKSLNFKIPTPATEDLYFKSINASVDQYRIYLEEVGTNRLVSFRTVISILGTRQKRGNTHWQIAPTASC